MAQDAGQDEVLNTHALDMVTLPGGTVSTEMEADMIRGVLESADMPVLVTAAAQYPNLGFEVKVPRGRVVEAEALLAEAREAGPAAAEAAEADSEV